MPLSCSPLQEISRIRIQLSWTKKGSIPLTPPESHQGRHFQLPWKTSRIPRSVQEERQPKTHSPTIYHPTPTLLLVPANGPLRLLGRSSSSILCNIIECDVRIVRQRNQAHACSRRRQREGDALRIRRSGDGAGAVVERIAKIVDYKCGYNGSFHEV
jgi:hypothetical protein